MPAASLKILPIVQNEDYIFFHGLVVENQDRVNDEYLSVTGDPRDKHQNYCM